MAKDIEVLLLVGSLRVLSHHRTLARAVEALAPRGFSVRVHPDLELPLFSPDRAAGSAVLDLRSALDAADAVMIASPEYAHGVSGVIKNALDWVVTSNQLSGKPVGVLNASPMSTHAWHGLMETVRTMDAVLVPEACVQATLDAPFAGPHLGLEQLVAHPQTSRVLCRALRALGAVSSERGSSS